MNQTRSHSPAIRAADFSQCPDAVLRLMALTGGVPLAISDVLRLAGSCGNISPHTQEWRALILPRFTADQALTTLRMRNRRVLLLAAMGAGKRARVPPVHP